MLHALPDPLDGLEVFERGWLSSNNVLVHAARGEPGAWLVDSSHVNHAAQTVALVQRALGGRPLAGVVNTHLHSDHCGGNASLQRAFDARVHVPPGQAEAVRAWDEGALSYESTGQRMERFDLHGLLAPGEPFVAGGREWQVLAAPGHDTHMVMLFDRANGLLISADTLWENGFGLIFPELDGEPGFDDMAEALDAIARLPVRVVVPGHGRPFADAGAALARARERLAGFRADPAKHARHALRVLLKYHLMEEQAQPLADLLDWAERTPLLEAAWRTAAPRGAKTARDWIAQTVAALVDSGALALDGLVVRDA